MSFGHVRASVRLSRGLNTSKDNSQFTTSRLGEFHSYFVGAAEVLVHNKCVWGQVPWTRGRTIEQALAESEYASWNHVGNGSFETFDFQKGNNWVSLKTVDTSSPTALSRMQTVVDKLVWAKNANPAYDILLDIRVPSWYQNELSSLLQYVKGKGINVKISVYK